ncbi:pyridoxamine 5'-phosphate oxidase family protein [Thermodesulfobacteriota bacterium]
MRRNEQEITDKTEIESILDKATVIRIGLCYNDVPYVVPVCFGRRLNRLYFHSSQEGRKIEIIRANNHVCFEAEIGVEVVPAESACDWTVKYKSVIGFGKAFLVEEDEEKEVALQVIMQHYSGKTGHELMDSAVDLAAIVRIDIESMTGKRSKA